MNPEFRDVFEHCDLCHLVKGMRIRPDPLPVINDRRRDFCSKFDGYGDFCTCT